MNRKHQWDLQRELTLEIVERFMALYCLPEHLLATWEQERCHTVLKTWSFQVRDGITAMGHACLNRLT